MWRTQYLHSAFQEFLVQTSCSMLPGTLGPLVAEARLSVQFLQKSSRSGSVNPRRANGEYRELFSKAWS